MKEKFIVTLEDVKEFLEKKLGLCWDGNVYDYEFEKNSDLIKLVNKEKAIFSKKVGTANKSNSLLKMIVARDRQGVDSYYSLGVDSFLEMRVWEYDKYGFKTNKRFGYCDAIWREFLVEKYGDIVKNEMIEHHKENIEELVATRDDLMGNIYRIEKQINREKKFIEELGQKVIIEDYDYSKNQEENEIDF